MRSVATALIVVAGGALASGVSARRAAVARGEAEPVPVILRRAAMRTREAVRRRLPESLPVPAGVGASVARPGTGHSGAGSEPGAASQGTRDRPDAPGRPAGARGFVPALEGLRGLAAVGVVTTHVAFVTRSSTGSPIKRLFGRLDLAVAVFFAKSGFLLWRAHADHARRDRPGTARPTREYLRSRLVRIMPAYTVLVFAAMLLVKQNHVNGLGSWIANLTLTQIYTTDFLVAGLTHAWSLAVEMAY